MLLNLKLLAASREESSKGKEKSFFVCSLTPWQATGIALANYFSNFMKLFKSKRYHSLIFTMLILGMLATLPSAFAKVESNALLFSSREIDPNGNSVLHYLDSRFYNLRQLNEKTLQALRRAIEGDPDSSYLHTELSRSLGEGKQFEQAMLEVEKALSLDSKNAAAWLLKGKLNAVKGESLQAIQDYEQCIRLAPLMEECYTMLARQYIAQKDYERAVQSVQRLLKQDPTSSEGLYYLATIYASDADKVKKAIGIFNRMLEMDPHDLKALLSLAEIYLEDKKLDEALAVLKRIEAVAPNDASIKLRMGLVYYDLKQTEQAIESFTKALELSPLNDRVSYYLGLLEAQRKNYDKALRYFKNVPVKSELYAEAALRIPLVYQEINQSEEAIRYLKKNAKSLRRLPNYYEVLSSLYLLNRDYRRAEKTLTEGLSAFPDHEKLLFSQGVLFDRRGQFDKSMGVMKKILELNPQNVSALNYVGYSYADKGVQLQEALRMISEAHRLSPKDGHILDSLGWVYFKLGNKTKALEFLKKANELKPDEPVILEHLGDVYLSLGDHEKAKAYFQDALAASVKQEQPEENELKDRERIRAKLETLGP